MLDGPNINTLKFVINTVPCNTASYTTWSCRGPAFRLLVDERDNHNKKKKSIFGGIFIYLTN